MDAAIQAEVRGFRDQAVARGLRPLLLVLTLLYGTYTIVAFVPGNPRPPSIVLALWGGSALLFGTAAALWGWAYPPASRAHAAMAVIAAVVVVNASALVHASDVAFLGFAFGVILLGFSILVLSIPLFATLTTAVAAAWLAALPSLQGDPYVFPMNLILASAGAIAMLNQVLRVRANRELSVLRVQERRAEAQRLRAALEGQELEQLRGLDTFKNRFLNNAAHELGTPLTPIKVQLHLLRSQLAEHPEHREAVDILERNVARLEDHVRQLLDAARVQSASLGLQPTAVPLRELLATAVDGFRAPAEQKSLQLLVDEGPDVTVMADRRRLLEVLTRLLDNAGKFTPRGGSVRVSSEHQPNGVRIRIQDTGVGLSPEQLQRLFLPYEQLHENADIVRSGVGLGLYLSRAIVQLHGGQLWARSLGASKGAEFMVDLPLAPSTRGTEAAATRSPSV